MKKIFKITGMKCDHCRIKVENAIKGVKGVAEAKVDLAEAEAQVEGDFDVQSIVDAVEDAGFEAE